MPRPYSLPILLLPILLFIFFLFCGSPQLTGTVGELLFFVFFLPAEDTILSSFVSYCSIVLWPNGRLAADQNGEDRWFPYANSFMLMWLSHASPLCVYADGLVTIADQAKGNLYSCKGIWLLITRRLCEFSTYKATFSRLAHKMLILMINIEPNIFIVFFWETFQSSHFNCMFTSWNFIFCTRNIHAQVLFWSRSWCQTIYLHDRTGY